MRLWQSALAATCLCLVLGRPSARAADIAIEQLVGGVEAVAFVCTNVDAKSAKKATELLQKTVAQYKLDLAAVRASENYRLVYNPEVNRMLSLGPKERLQACQSAL
jgi:hypothetical protein